MDDESGDVVPIEDEDDSLDPFKRKIPFRRRGGLAAFIPSTLLPTRSLDSVARIKASSNTPEEPLDA